MAGKIPRKGGGKGTGLGKGGSGKQGTPGRGRERAKIVKSKPTGGPNAAGAPLKPRPKGTKSQGIS
jgi:hypothetical protein